MTGEHCNNHKVPISVHYFSYSRRMPISILVGKEVLLVQIKSDLIMSFPARTINKTLLNYLKTENHLLKRDALVEMTVKVAGASSTSLKRIVGEKDGTKSPGKSRPKRKKTFMSLTLV